MSEGPVRIGNELITQGNMGPGSLFATNRAQQVQEQMLKLEGRDIYPAKATVRVLESNEANLANVHFTPNNGMIANTSATFAEGQATTGQANFINDVHIYGDLSVDGSYPSGPSLQEYVLLYRVSDHVQVGFYKLMCNTTTAIWTGSFAAGVLGYESTTGGSGGDYGSKGDFLLDTYGGEAYVKTSDGWKQITRAS